MLLCDIVQTTGMCLKSNDTYFCCTYWTFNLFVGDLMFLASGTNTQFQNNIDEWRWVSSLSVVVYIWLTPQSRWTTNSSIRSSMVRKFPYEIVLPLHTQFDFCHFYCGVKSEFFFSTPTLTRINTTHMRQLINRSACAQFTIISGLVKLSNALQRPVTTVISHTPNRSVDKIICFNTAITFTGGYTLDQYGSNEYETCCCICQTNNRRRRTIRMFTHQWLERNWLAERGNENIVPCSQVETMKQKTELYVRCALCVCVCVSIMLTRGGGSRDNRACALMCKNSGVRWAPIEKRNVCI